MQFLAVGDVVGEPGLALSGTRSAAAEKAERDPIYKLVNGENASGVGLMPEQAWRIYDAGADVVTLGNHTFGKMQIRDMLEETLWLLRPANYASRAPGRGCGIFEGNGLRIRVINLIGRCGLDWKAEDPFTTADRLVGTGPRGFYAGGFSRRGHQREAGAGVLSGRAG